ncbi:MAG: NAD-dependent epimerase/dehydratase family protein [Woeseia sp.]
MRAEKDIVIVTGSSGYIGSAVVKALAGGYRVLGLDRAKMPHPPQDAESVCLDLTDIDSVRSAFEQVKAAHGTRIASVIHLAAYFDLTGKPSPAYEAVTLGGTNKLLECLAEFKVEQFIFISTMLVHAAARPGERIDESTPIDPKLPYRASKARTEKMLREKARDFPVVILRPAGVYDEECHSAFLASQIAGIYEQRLIAHFYPGDLATGQSYLHLSDLTEAIRGTVENRFALPDNSAMLLGEEDVMGYAELQRELGRLIHGEPWKTLHVPGKLAHAGTWIQVVILQEDQFQKPWMVDIANDHYAIDIGRARELIGWSPSHSLRGCLPAIAERLKRDPFAWYRENKLNAARVAQDKVRVADSKAESADSGEVHEMHEHEKSMTRMHFRMLWVHFATMMLGLWLAASPFAFGTFGQEQFSDAVLRVTAERGLWEPEVRNFLTAWNNLIVGVLIMVFAALSLSRRGGLAQWANATLGVWLLFAPVVLWTPSAAVYANDTLVGAFVIAFTILIPMMPGMSHEGMMDPSEVPPGWTYSPSTYLQRVPIIALGIVGVVLARILAAYQLGHVNWVWEPFFPGDGTRNGSEYIITSEVSKAWPVADGGLGAITYMFEVLMGIMGGRSRWRTMPWMVVLFGIAVVPLGVISIYFIIIQPIVIGTYCTLCLITALGMLIMIPLSLDEIVAMGQFTVANTRRGRPFWRSFFRGDALPGGAKDTRPGFEDPIREAFASAVRGVTVPWTLLASSLIGVWLMFSRMLFDTAAPLADSDHLVGALVVTVAVIAMAEVARPLRFMNVLFGLWLIASPWLMDGGQAGGSFSTMTSGLLLIGLSLPRGRRSDEHYGQWDRLIV